MPKKSHISPTLFMADTLETTLCIIKPDAMHKRKEILRKILRKGFLIMLQKKFQLSPEQAADFYQEYESLRTYMLMVLNLSKGPIEVAILTKEDAIDQFIGLMGPEKPSVARCMCPGSLRGIYGDCEDDLKNAVHGSLNAEAAKREIHFFYPNFIIDPIAKDEVKKFCCRIPLIDPLMTGMQQLSKERPSEPIIWTAKWFLENNPMRPAIGETTLEECILKQKLEKETRPPCPESAKISYKLEVPSTTSSTGTSALTSSSGTIVCSCTSSRSQTSSSRQNLPKILCCCDVEVKPDEVVVCPLCEKIVQYTVPVENFSKSSTLSSSSSSTTAPGRIKMSESTTTSQQEVPTRLIDGTCKIQSSSSKTSPFSTQTSSTPSKDDSDDLLHAVLNECPIQTE